MREFVAEVAKNHEIDWTGWTWLAAAVALVGAVALLVIWGAVLVNNEDTEHAGRLWLVRVAMGVGGLASLGVLLVLPGTMMRHFPVQWPSVVLALVMLIVGALFLWMGWATQSRGGGRGYFDDRDSEEISAWWSYVPGGLAVLGAVGGVANDGITRLAAGIPMAVGTLLALVLAGGIFFWVKASER